MLFLLLNSLLRKKLCRRSLEYANCISSRRVITPLPPIIKWSALLTRRWVHLPYFIFTMLYKNTKVKIRSPDGDTDFFNIDVGVLKRDKWAPYLFIIFLDYVLRTSIDQMKENGFTLKKKTSSRRHPAQTITDAD